MSHSSPKTEKAAQMDAEGNFNEAIILLSQASKEGDLQAGTELGRRLLLGDRAPRMPKEGACMLLEAARENHAEAVALMALLQAMGVQQKKNWQDALASLTHAACLGWLPARRQLLLLAPEAVAGADEEFVATAAANVWQQLGGSIDVNKWLALPPGSLLCEAPMLVSFPGFIAPALCELFMALARPRLQTAFNSDPTQMRNPNAERASHSIAQIGLVENDFIHLLLQERMSKACGIAQEQMEGMSILHYQPGEEFSAHCDYFDPAQALGQHEISQHGQRCLTFLIYLNDDYEGGETDFSSMGIRHKGRAGEALYFVNVKGDGSPDSRTLHAGTPPLQGEKWVLSQYFRDRSLKFLR